MIKNGMLFVKDGVTVQVQELTTGLFCLFEVAPGAAGTRTLLQDAKESNRWQYTEDELTVRLEGWDVDKRQVAVNVRPSDEQISATVKEKVKKGKI